MEQALQEEGKGVMDNAHEDIHGLRRSAVALLMELETECRNLEERMMKAQALLEQSGVHQTRILNQALAVLKGERDDGE